MLCRTRSPAKSNIDATTGKALQNMEQVDSGELDTGVILGIQVFRLHAGRSVVNVQVFDGSLIVGMRLALTTLFAIYRTLAQAQQQTAGAVAS